MNNNIKIRKMYWENLRNFETLELPSKDKKFSDKTSLVQIQNGYGKTTTLYLSGSMISNLILSSITISSTLISISCNGGALHSP